ncbi:aminotransferase class V-fold PLP-dependent enzyme [Streptomyces sudanensis]|uniref:pyridoxal phosphate-dependent decarboxylase family protein n=1 Tax=Streptomyces sudanensis TaxID=436397 RepID=UPI0020CF44C3|nr:pyridoxal-dependent decarboxylase [Streptomyces sudanensis]MCP9985900.1 aminotransferase class V-fold PLP-dependent enzyme [Streptomyces sudanensis]
MPGSGAADVHRPAAPLPPGEVDLALAGGVAGAGALGKLAPVVLDALAEGAAARGGPLPGGGPGAVAGRLRAACAPVLPEHGTGAEEALRTLVRAVAEGSADPADPWCAAHLHCPPLAVAAAADLAAAALNPSMDSWDQAPAAAALEREVTAAVAALVYPRRTAPDALVTSGGTESNLVALLLARERARAAGAAGVTVVCGATAHHSVRRAAWLLGLPAPVPVDCPGGRADPEAVGRALARVTGPALVVATAGTTDEGLIDPLRRLAATAARHGAELHVDAAYGGALLFSDRLAPLLDGLESAVSVTLDLHKLGWQPVAAGFLAVPGADLLGPLSLRADYLNADDDGEAGLPDLLGRSLRTSRRPDVLKIAATLRALGRTGLGALVEHCVAAAREFAALVDAHPAVRRRPGGTGVSTVLFRPLAADAAPAGEGDALVAEVRRRLLAEGRAVVGRAVAEDADGTRRLWLKATLLHPRAAAGDLAGLLDLAAGAAARVGAESARNAGGAR